MVSSRFSLIVIFLLSLALVPTIIHSYIKAKTDDGITVSTLIPIIDGFSSEPYTRHNDAWVKTMFDSEDWVERVYNAPDGVNIRLFMTRSYDHKRLYHHPELGLSHGGDFRSIGVVMFGERPKVPVHLLRHSSGSGLVAYALLADGKFIENPVLHQISESLVQLVSASRQMTLFYVADSSTSNSTEFNQTAAAMVLKAAIESFAAKTNTKVKTLDG
ncbi:MAG: hypothetical protein H6964_17575 [Chromatiaceae bacterium]|nr:hypothetical protein [Gammaproteobacteria bacterium]MCP5428269.1 hypothetical protein [Chromatiaceae bacterium]MCP5448789.1 hypothetical protein [Chromatiaceae bacterium]